MKRIPKPASLLKSRVCKAQKVAARRGVEIEVEPNDNEGRWELWFYLTTPDGRRTGHYYSVLGMIKGYPQFREAILAASRKLHNSLSREFHARLDRAIARAEQTEERANERAIAEIMREEAELDPYGPCGDMSRLRF